MFKSAGGDLPSAEKSPLSVRKSLWPPPQIATAREPTERAVAAGTEVERVAREHAIIEIDHNAGVVGTGGGGGGMRGVDQISFFHFSIFKLSVSVSPSS